MIPPPTRLIGAGAGRTTLGSLLLAGLVAACYLYLDRPAALWAHGLSEDAVRASRVVSAFGHSAVYLAGLAAAYPILRFALRRPLLAQRALLVFAAVAVSGLAADLAKAVAGRWRPIALFAAGSNYGFAFFRVGYAYNSFPSGHATTAGALACVLTLLYPRLRVLWYGAAALVAASRVTVGAHYPADVVAGLWLGVVTALWLARSSRFRDALATPPGAGRLTSAPSKW